MNKNNLIGFILIGLVLIGFSLWNRPSEEELAKQQQKELIEKKNKEEQTKAKAKADAASAIVALKKAKEDIAKANLNKDPDNEELKAALQKAQSELKNAQAELEKAKLAEKIANLDTVELKKVGDTNVYKSDDGKYTVDLGNDKVTDGKTLAVGRGSYKLYEIDENSTDAGAPKHTDKTVLYSHDKGGSVYKNGVEQFSFLSKDGNAVAALKAGGKGFILKPGVKTDYDTMSKANFNDADGKFEIGGADQKTYKIETEKNPSPHNPDNPRYSVTKIKNFEGRDYDFQDDKPILDGDFKITGTKDLNDDLKIPLINGKIYAGYVGDHDNDYDNGKNMYRVYTDGNNNIKRIFKDTKNIGELNYNFDADEKVESIDNGFTYILKDRKTFKEALELTKDQATLQDALNKASSTVLAGSIVYTLDDDGNVKSVRLFNKNELTAKGSTPFNPKTIDNDLKIDKIKFASGEEFKLTGDHTYVKARNYEKVADKFLLEGPDGYVNSVYEQSPTHKFTVTDAGVGKYTLTETKDGKKVSEEKLDKGILKTIKYDADGHIKSVEMEDKRGDSDTSVSVNDDPTDLTDTKKVNINDVNSGKVILKGVETVYVKSTANALDGKGLDYLNKSGAKEIELDSDLSLTNKDGGTLDLGKIKYGSHKLTVEAGNTKSDTIKFGAKQLAGDKLNINGFEQTQDKVDFSALGATDKKVNKVESNAEKGLENGKIYTTDVAGNIDENDYANSDFGELFGNGKTFKTITANGKSIVAVKGNDKTKVYQVNDADGSGTIDAGEVKLVGTFESNVELGDANIA